MKIKIDDLHEAWYNVASGIAHFHKLNLPNDEIKVLVPTYLAGALKTYYSRPGGDWFPNGEIPIFPSNDPWDNIKYRNIQMLPHYKNEIVVFAVNWSFYEKLREPIIFELPELTK